MIFQHVRILKTKVYAAELLLLCVFNCVTFDTYCPVTELIMHIQAQCDVDMASISMSILLSQNL